MKRSLTAILIAFALVALAGLFVFAIAVLHTALWPEHFWSLKTFGLAFLLICAGRSGWQLSKPSSPKL